MKNIAISNGYSRHIIDKNILIFRLGMKVVSSFQNGNHKTTFVFSHHRYTRNLGNMFKDPDITVVFKSNETLLGNQETSRMVISKNIRNILCNSLEKIIYQ